MKKISRSDLQWAVDNGVLQPGQDEALWRALEQRTAERPRFDGVHVAYYTGALIVIGAMGWFMGRGWESFSGGEIAMIAACYATAFLLVGRELWDRRGLRVPGGLLFTMAVGMVPLFTYGVLRHFDLWAQGDPGAYRGFHVWIKGSWVTLELATILAGLLVVRWRRFPFVTAPIAFALWYLAMDLGPLLLGVPELDWQTRYWVTASVGFVMLIGAYVVDLRGEAEDFAFWVYLFGVLAFWGGLSVMESDSELGKFVYALINVMMMVASVLLRRRVFVVFGALGLTGYIGSLAHRHFEDSVFFPFALTFAGLAVIALGVLYQRRRKELESLIQARVPAGLRRFLPPRARADF